MSFEQRTDRILISKTVLVEGVLNAISDPAEYDINFYDNSRKVLSVKYHADVVSKTNLKLKLNVTELCEIVVHIIDYFNRKGILEIGQTMNREELSWVVENFENFEDFASNCEKIIKENEGWEHYAKTKVL